MHAKKRPGLIIHSNGCVNAMAKWSLRIELQAMDIGEHCPIDGKIHSVGEILDSFDSFLHRKWTEFGFHFKARTFDQEETSPPSLSRQRCPILYQIPSPRCVNMRKGAAYTCEPVRKRGFVHRMSETYWKGSGFAEGMGAEGLLFEGLHRQIARSCQERFGSWEIRRGKIHISAEWRPGCRSEDCQVCAVCDAGHAWRSVDSLVRSACW